ncbi:hypothetical protein KPH14_005908 [Odynerus spinipes]|uniref:Uncharacterized protein n=1 Tax=Odynerus spinipes TaxID=1348599 RepID=A0AAD9RJJ4_9HYME|nr:hypothetical protein KPH14_005908 [Odynerus spinipes]
MRVRGAYRVERSSKLCRPSFEVPVLFPLPPPPPPFPGIRDPSPEQSPVSALMLELQKRRKPVTKAPELTHDRYYVSRHVDREMRYDNLEEQIRYKEPCSVISYLMYMPGTVRPKRAAFSEKVFCPF